MHFSTLAALLLSTATLTLAAPVPLTRRVVSGARQFSALSIAGGIGGNALAEAQAKFPGDPTSLNSATQQAFNADARCSVSAEQAFLDAGAIPSSSAATNAVSVGLFKNKVLKLFGQQVALQAQIALKGNKPTAAQTAQLADLAEKLAANVKVDKTNAGLESEDVKFTCPDADTTLSTAKTAKTALAITKPAIINNAATVAGARQFADFTIAGGVGGNALAEAKAAFPGSADSLSKATQAAFNDDAHCTVLAEQAFLDGGAIASSNRASNAISVGLFKNKVLKLYGTQLALQSQIALSGKAATADQTAQLADLATKLAANVKVDETNKGLASESASFAC